MQQAVRVWRQQQKDKKSIGRSGVILSWTEISVAPPRFESSLPYTIVLVEYETKERVYGQLVDFEDAERLIGARVTSILRRSGDVGPEDVIEYGIKFRPE
ncbi:OB-fold domain-containing protein [Candidatus Woesebacteria bacterium]|nr:OB-fold domain-containing protein [Candidatus Woesebacteria bacterium]